jgi:hypothetical protein
LEKKKRDFQFYSSCGPKLSWKPSPARPAASVFPTPVCASRGRAAQPASLPCSRLQPSAAQRPAEATPVSFLAGTRPRRAHPAPPAAGHQTDPVPMPGSPLSHATLVPAPDSTPTPDFLPPHGNHRIQTEDLSPTRLIVKSSTNPQRTRYESSTRLEEISRMLFRSCWTPWPTSRSTEAPPTITFPHRRSRTNQRDTAPLL